MVLDFKIFSILPGHQLKPDDAYFWAKLNADNKEARRHFRFFGIAWGWSFFGFVWGSKPKTK